MNQRNFIITAVAFGLTLIAMTAEQFTAHPASGEKENETSTEQIEVEITTETESLEQMDSKVDSESNGNSLPFDKSHFQFNCTEDFAHAFKIEMKPFYCDTELLPFSSRPTPELPGLLEQLIKSARRFACTPNEVLGRSFISVSQEYLGMCKDSLPLPNLTVPIDKTRGLNTTQLCEHEVIQTNILCATHMMELAERLTELINESNEIKAIKKSIVENIDESTGITSVLVWQDTVGRQEILVNLLQSCVQKAVNASKYREYDFSDILISDRNSYLLNVNNWTDLLEDEKETQHRYKSKQVTAEHIRFLLDTVAPPVISTFFVVGITGNGLLLTIFIRHKKIRTFQNSMLINLAAVDCLTLLTNVLLDYFSFRLSLQLGVLNSKLLCFFAYMFLLVSIYSVVTLSIQRFMAVRKLLLGTVCQVGRRTMCVVVASVWALGFIFSLPHALYADVTTSLCYLTPLDEFIMTDIVVMCLLPVTLVAVFSGLTAARIRRSAGSIPGEGVGQERLRHSRIVSSALLIALLAIFLLCHTPRYMFAFLVFHKYISSSIEHSVTVAFVTYYLRYVHCCLNPLALFVMSKRFRVYLNDVICCGGRN
jgi:gastrin-releasing peptide receptor